MPKKSFKRKNELSGPVKNFINLLFSSSLGLLSTIIITFIVSLIITSSSEYPKYTSVFFIISVIISCIISGFIASKKCNFKGIISGLLCSIPYSLFITVIMLFFTNCKLKESTIILYLIIIICSTIGGIVGANTKRRK